MSKFEFVDDIPELVRCGNVALLREFAAELKRQPGCWAKYPGSVSGGSKGASARAYSIRRGLMSTFKTGYEAAVRGGVIYVRYVGGPAS